MSGLLREVVHAAATQAATPRAARRRPKKSDAVKVRHPSIGMGKDGPPTDARMADDYLYGEGEAK
jgi:hypothetical protein